MESANDGDSETDVISVTVHPPSITRPNPVSSHPFTSGSVLNREDPFGSDLSPNSQHKHTQTPVSESSFPPLKHQPHPTFYPDYLPPPHLGCHLPDELSTPLGTQPHVIDIPSILTSPHPFPYNQMQGQVQPVHHRVEHPHHGRFYYTEAPPPPHLSRSPQHTNDRQSPKAVYGGSRGDRRANQHIRGVAADVAPHIAVSEIVGPYEDAGAGVPTSSSLLRHKPRIDVRSDAVNYVIEVELPGVEKSDVRLKLTEENMLTVSGLHKLSEQFIEDVRKERKLLSDNQSSEGVTESGSKEDGEGMDGMEGEEKATRNEDNVQEHTSVGDKPGAGQAREEDHTWHVRERKTGLFERSVRLPSNLMIEHITAKFENGVLMITVPMKDAEDKMNVNIL
eukprot:GHVQ01004480.1.p1 GENE.GHVQ01004480.1~~GHVQ01004480.1.p1  ORF type:complete len:393 (-),score=77.17 GHVQ01004480.1:792-1970(-)